MYLVGFSWFKTWLIRNKGCLVHYVIFKRIPFGMAYCGRIFWIVQLKDIIHWTQTKTYKASYRSGRNRYARFGVLLDQAKTRTPGVMSRDGMYLDFDACSHRKIFKRRIRPEAFVGESQEFYESAIGSAGNLKTLKKLTFTGGWTYLTVLARGSWKWTHSEWLWIFSEFSDQGRFYFQRVGEGHNSFS